MGYTSSMEKHFRMAELLAYALDNSFSVGGFRFGFSAVIGLIPVVGDGIDVLLSLYLVWIAYKLHVPLWQMIRMVWNIAVSFVIGIIPFLGDAAYLFRKANMKNLRILKRYAPAALEGKVIS
jgi:hypothetical protein